MLKPSPQYDGIWRWGLWEELGREDGPPMDKISAFVRKDTGEIIPLPCKKDNHLQMRKRDLTRT